MLKEHKNCEACRIGADAGHIHPTKESPLVVNETGPTLRDWEEEFEEIFIRIIANDVKDKEASKVMQALYDAAYQPHKKRIKDFIKDILASHDAALLKYIEGQKKEIEMQSDGEYHFVNNAKVASHNHALELVEKFIKDTEYKS